jgi:hypothetical protein
MTVTARCVPEADSRPTTVLMTAPRQRIVSAAVIQSAVRRPGRAATMPIVCGNTSGDPYGAVYDKRPGGAGVCAQRSGASTEVSPNSPRSAKSTASEVPGGGGSVAGGTSSGA